MTAGEAAVVMASKISPKGPTSGDFFCCRATIRGCIRSTAFPAADRVRAFQQHRPDGRGRIPMRQPGPGASAERCVHAGRNCSRLAESDCVDGDAVPANRECEGFSGGTRGRHLAGFQLLPLFRRVQHFPGVGSVVFADDSVFRHVVDHAGSPAITNAQGSLQQ